MRLSSIVSIVSPFAILTVVMGLVYTSVQQCYRMGANDPQIQLAQDLSDRLSRGKPVDYFFSGDSLDISRSLGMFGILYNASGQPVKATGFLDEKMAQLPMGVFDFAYRYGENRISWQPREGVRAAMVVVKVNSPDVSFVAVGRSLKEVEVREKNLSLMILLGWSICMGILIVRALFQLKFKRI